MFNFVHFVVMQHLVEVKFIKKRVLQLTTKSHTFEWLVYLPIRVWADDAICLYMCWLMMVYAYTCV